MKNFVICITDADRVDRQIIVNADESVTLGQAAHLALDQVMKDVGAKMQFPIFLDIHPAEHFDRFAWLQRN